MKMQKCPHCSEENKIYARVCSYCMKTIGVEHKIKMSSVGNWVIVFFFPLSRLWFRGAWLIAEGVEILLTLR